MALVVLMTGLAAGLIGAAVQVAVQMVNALILARLIFSSRDVVWMAPIAWLAFSLGLAVFGAVGALLVPRLPWATMSLVGFVTVTGAVLLAPFEQIATWAATVVSLGIGVQLSRWLRPEGASWPPRLRRVSTALVVAFALVGTGAAALRGLRERRAVDALGAARDGAPNVLLIVLDVVRAANLSAYGYARPTSPVLEAFARTGVQFDRAYAAAPWTLPSHASMFTGRYPTELRAGYRRALESAPETLAEAFRLRGYRTGGFTANEVYTAWDSRINRGFERWSDYRRTPTQVRYSGLPWQTTKIRELLDARTLRDVWVTLRYLPLRAPANLSFHLKRGHMVSEEFLDWESGIDGRPFFAFINLYDAHRPRYAPPEVAARFDSGGRPAVDRYDAAVSYVDSEVGVILDSLRARGDLDRTIVAIVGDHGELLGEHDFVGHSNMVYRDLLWVPFVVSYGARLPSGAHVATPVSLRDLGATLLDLAGVEPSGHTIPGTSLLPLARGASDAATSPVFSYAQQGSNVEARFPNSTGPLYSLVVDSMHYIRHPREELLFNLATDGAEQHNLAADPGHATVLAAARHVVDSLLQYRYGGR
ncbi:MAG: sulfatase [Gemmatimonadaceae bacterium]|nr:sulfatase [Gemmatimonadaceae bacterium]